MNWKLDRLPSYLEAYLKRTPAPRVFWRAQRLAASLGVVLFFLCTFYSVAAAQIVLDGIINEPDWHQLGNSTGGPPPSVAGNEINALSASINSTHLYIGVAGNVQFNNRILVFIDSMPGGYMNGNFGRASAPPGIIAFNQNTVFDDGFTPNYVLSISTNNGQLNYFWDLYTLSGSFGSGGGPNLLLGDRNDADLRANPANIDQTRGFEARLTYSANGSGFDIAINQPEIRMMAMYINDNGTLSNQFISHANLGEVNDFGSGPILFNAEAAVAGPVFFGYMLVVNEVDYIQPGANTAEFIEIKNITNIPISLDAFRLRFARGVNSPPEIYRDIDLPNVILNPGAYFVICTNPANVPNCNTTVEPAMDLLENALPAAVALVQNNIIVDVVSYGGNTGAPYTEGSGVVPADDPNQPALGMSRIVDGQDTNRNSVDFGMRCITPGQTNSSQTSGCGPATPTFTPTLTPTPTGTAVTPTPTGTATPTGTPTPTGSVTTSPTPTGSVTPGVPTGCTNVLVNGDFESSYGWGFGQDPIPGKYTSIPVHSGIRSVQLGNPPESGYASVYSYSSVRQGVSIPRGATLQLRWWHFHHTELGVLGSTDNTQDRQEVILLKPNGDTLRIVQRTRRNDSGWQQDIIDLTEYAGYSFVLYFNVINYGGARTWTFIDDVELLVCSPQGVATVPYGNNTTLTPTPTYTQIPPVTPTPTPTPTATQPTPSTPPGNTIEQDGYALTAFVVENPSTRFGPLYVPEAGTKLVAVEIRLRNISGQTFSSNLLQATLVDTSGSLYGSKSGIVQGELELLDVNQGDRVRGWVGFIVPENVTPASLRYQFSGSGATLQVDVGSLGAVSAAFTISDDGAIPADTATPTVTPTNTGEPSPTPTVTSTAVAFVPSTPETLAVQAASQSPLTPQPVAALQAAPTPTLVLVSERVVVPDHCVELVDNGTFEARGMGWSQLGSAILPEYSAPHLATGAVSQSGMAIRLGLVGKVSASGISATQQLVELPKESNEITLRFHYFPQFETPPSRGDFQYVDIYDGDSGQFVGRALGVQQNDRVWIDREYDLSDYAGETVRLFFMVSNDGVDGNIAMYIDDVSVLACRVEKTAPTNLAAVITTAQPVANANVAQPFAMTNGRASTSSEDTPDRATEIVAETAPNPALDASAELLAAPPGFSFGRMGGLLAVLGIAGAALVLLPLTRRFTK